MIIEVGFTHAHDLRLLCKNLGHATHLRVKLNSMGVMKDQKYTVSGDVLFQEVNGETVLLDLASENYFGLDEIGTRIWSLINEGRAVGEMAGTLMEEYQVDRGTLECDIGDLVNSLLEAGLISVNATGSPSREK